MTVGNLKRALDLLHKHNVPEHIINHSMRVNEIAMYLAEKFRQAGIHLNTGVIDLASLLHDIDKHKTFNDSEQHGKESERILLAEGVSEEIATIARKHHLSTILLKGEEALQTWEEKVVYYADKRVVHDKPVSLEERFNYLRQRYGNISEDALETINKCEPKVTALEKEIFSKINAEPDLKEMKKPPAGSA